MTGMANLSTFYFLFLFTYGDCRFVKEEQSVTIRFMTGVIGRGYLTRSGDIA